MNKYKPKKIITIVFSAVLFICAGFGAAAGGGLYTAELFGGMIACRTNPDISVAANVGVFADLYGLSRREQRERLPRLAAALGLP